MCSICGIVDFEAENGKLSVKLDGLERFFSIKVKINSSSESKQLF